VRGMLPATPAELLQLEAVRSRRPVLRRRVVAPLSFTARPRDDLSGHCSLPNFAGADTLVHAPFLNRGAWLRRTAEGGSPYLFLPYFSSLLADLADGARADRVAAFADGEPQSLLHGNRGDQLNHQLYVVARPHHLGTRRHSGHSRTVRG